MAYLTPTQILLATSIAVAIAVLAYKSFIASKQVKGTYHLPPGPTPIPLVGNISDLPAPGTKDWIHWSKLRDQYGPIYSLTVLGQTMVVISDYKIAAELMEKRSAHTSGRPFMEFGSRMCGWENSLALQTDHSKVRSYRRAIHGIIGTSTAIDAFRPMLERESHQFLSQVLNNPDDILQLIRTQAGRIILKIGYGYTIEPVGRDPLVDLADEGLQQFTKSCAPGVWLVDVIPALKYLPEWLPGMEFKTVGKKWNATLHALADIPYAFVEKNLERGTAEPSYLSKLIGGQNGKLTPEDEDVARWSAFSLYTGGADTTVSSMASFVLAMALFPDVQKKAQAEIDAVIGHSRLPTFADRSGLPYIDAVVKEVLRWHPVAPLGVPHMTTKDDVYNDYSIPKNTILIPCIDAMLHDPTAYHDPETFEPSRFLGPHPEMDPHNISFGFGRRICPGRLFADATLFSTIAGFLAVFEVAKKVNKDGKMVEPVVDFLPGVISHPAPFECDIRPRSSECQELIRRVDRESPMPVHGDAKELDPIEI
jgi:cytochrome P450